VVAIIDIGSNSIKSLVASRDDNGAIVARLAETIDARISAGIGQARSRLSEEGMQRGLAAIQELLQGTAALAPARTVLVATSAVRDADNGSEFAERIRSSTGHELRILSGDEEANLIGRGLTADRQLAQLHDFYVFDLGGGSLECLTFRSRKVEQAISLPLGCVRLTERCVENPEGPFANEARAKVAAVCREVLNKSRFNFNLPANTPAVFTGGTITTVRAMLEAKDGKPLPDAASTISVAELRGLLEETAPRSLEARKQVPGLPAARADVFPTALATVLAIAEMGGFRSFLHSVQNLRYGLADELLRG
jgi:exopolyphosphatase/guanosine-5'-triphosphate,3'-diphosphate pyrophosphatase